MVSIDFLYFFLPLFVGLYSFFPQKHRYKLILPASCLFVAYSGVWGLIPFGIVIMVCYLCGIFIYNFRNSKFKKNLFFYFSIIVCIAAFVMFAYSPYYPVDFISGFSDKNDSNRLFEAFGVAFYAMNGLSYCSDIYLGKNKPEHSFFKTAAYIGFFPCMTAGPLLRYDDMSQQLSSPQVTSEKLADGIKFYLIGLSEKLIISNTLYEVWRNIRSVDISNISFVASWIGIISFSLSFYFELLSFSNMAKGFASMLGIDVPENFDKPFMSVSFGEWLRRFNITLYKWCNDYIYTHFGGRSEKGFAVISLVVTVFLGSFWYGFGMRVLLWFGIILVIILLEKAASNFLNKINHAIKLVLFNILYLFTLPVLAMPEQEKAVAYFMSMLGANAGSSDILTDFVFSTSFVIMIIGIICATNCGGFFIKKITIVNENMMTVITPVWEIALLLLCTAFLISGDHSYFGLLF